MTSLTNQMTFRLSDEDKRRLEEMAAHSQRTVGDFLRILINDEYDDTVGNNVPDS